MNISNKNTTLLVILGQKLNKNGQMEQDLINRLDKAADYYKDNTQIHILVTGKYSITYDWAGYKPRHFESQEMKKYLLSRGVPSYKIAMEQKSKDTVGNVYYAKQYAKQYPFYKNIIVVCATPHEQRIRIIFDKFFGSNYSISYITVESSHANQDKEYERGEIKKIIGKNGILQSVANGDDKAFKYQLYRNKFYRNKQ